MILRLGCCYSNALMPLRADRVSMIAVANPAFKPLKNAVANAENPSVVIYVTAGREVSRMRIRPMRFSE